MKKATLLLGIAAVVIGGVIVVPQAVLAYKGDPTVKGPNYTEERHQAMEKAFENRDYNAWKALMAGRGRASQLITADNFAKFAEAHELADQGKTEEAAKIRAELGLGQHSGSGMGQGMGAGRYSR